MKNDDQTTASAELQTELTVKLRTPVSLGSITYEELKLQEPTIAQLREAEKEQTSVGRLATLIAMNSGVPNGAVSQLRQRDAQECADFFARFGSAYL